MKTNRVRPRRFAALALWLSISLFAGLPVPVRAQVRPVYDYGASGLGEILRKLQTTATVMHTGAHPDDEDSSMLAYLARGLAARTAYLSLTRGDGGQNLLGSEQSEALGVIRTEELLQARRLDGAEQYFTRAFDYGFSKTLDEAKAKWPEHEVLGDMVRAIRIFRPLVVICRFSGTPADGHGQHQYAGYLTPIAVKAAADPAQFPEQLREGLRPWHVRKFYVGANPRNKDIPPTLRFDTGTYDPLLGRSYAEIASEGRSLHRTQEQGGLELRGPRFSGIRLISGGDGKPGPETGLFDGIDTSISGMGELNGLSDEQLRFELVRAEVAAKRALKEYNPFATQEIVPALVDGLRAVRNARTRLTALPDTPARYDTDGLLEQKEGEFTEAIRRAAGIAMDVIADRETLAPGDSCLVTVQAFYPGNAPVTPNGIGLNTPAGWNTVPAVAPTPSPGGEALPAGQVKVVQTTIKLSAAADLTPTQPYWLTEARDHDLFRWPDPGTKWSPSDARVQPFAPVGSYGVADFTIGGIDVQFKQALQYRYADGVRGEIRRNVEIVPALSLDLDQDFLIVPVGGAAVKQRLVVGVTNNADRAVSGEVRLRLPKGWKATPATVPLALKKKGDRLTTVFTVAPMGRPSPGSYPIVAEASSDGKTYDRQMRVLSYPHIQTHRIYEPAMTAVKVFDLKVAPVRVGYIMGAGDEVPDAIRRMGVPVTMLDENELAAGDLSGFDTIVVGVRATDTRPDFVANHERLLEFVRAGGNLIVQYQRPNYAALKLPPFPTQMGVRVTDENAAVTALHPEEQVLNWPNKITAADWDNWVQERTVYDFNDFGAEFVPQFQMQDPGEAPQKGGEIIAHLGRGIYVYTAFAWFRQLPAGVPGAYRLFANLLSRGKPPKAG